VTVPDSLLASPLRRAIAAVDYTVDAVDGLLCETARSALQRSETTPALGRTTDGSPLATLVRLFILQTPVPRSDADRADLVSAYLLAVRGLVDEGYLVPRTEPTGAVHEVPPGDSLHSPERDAAARSRRL
jgi:hypothetical protein